MRRFLSRRNIVAFLVGHVLIALAIGHARLRFDDDPLASLPAGDREVAAFRDVAGRYGAMDTLLVGIESPELFSRGSLERLRAFARGAPSIPGVAWAVAFTDVPLVTASTSRTEVSDLVPGRIPDDEGELGLLRRRVLSYDAVVGQLVSADGSAALVPVRLDGKRPAADVARDVDRAARRAFEGARVVMGGLPAVAFAMSVAMTSATPLLAIMVTGLLVVGLLLALRRLAVVLLAASAAALAAAASVVPFSFLRWVPPPGAAVGVLGVGVCALLAVSFVLSSTDRARGRARGSGIVVHGIVGSGVLASLVAALAGDLPVALVLATGSLAILALCALVLPVLVRDREADASRRSAVPRRRPLAAALMTVGAMAVYPGVPRLRPALDPAEAFPAGSGPAEAQAFLDGRFGGTDTLLVEVRGDVATPEALDALRAIEATALADRSVREVLSLLVAVRTGAKVDGRPSELPQTAQAVRRFLYMAGGQPTMKQFVRPDGAGTAAYVRLARPNAPEDAARVRDALASAVPGVSRFARFDEGPGAPGARMEAEILDRLALRLEGLEMPPEARSDAVLREMIAEIGSAASADLGALRALVADHFADGTTFALVRDVETNEPSAVGNAELDAMVGSLASAGSIDEAAARAALLAAFPAAAADAEGLDAESRLLARSLEKLVSGGARDPSGASGGLPDRVRTWAIGGTSSRAGANEAAGLLLAAARELRSGGVALPAAAGVDLDVRVAGMPLAGPSASVGVVRSLTLAFLVAAVALLAGWIGLLAIRSSGGGAVRVGGEAMILALVPLASVSAAFGAAGLLGLPIEPGATSTFAALLACTGAAGALLVGPWTSPDPAPAAAADARRIGRRLLPAIAAATASIGFIPLPPARTTAFLLAAALVAALALGLAHSGERRAGR